jgi:hypothetical protein
MSLEQDEPYEEESLNPDEDDGEDEDEDEEEARSDEVLSPSSQIGREQAGGSHVSGQEPGAETREGWPMPDQSDTPPEWPEPTID